MFINTQFDARFLVAALTDEYCVCEKVEEKNVFICTVAEPTGSAVGG